MRRRLFRWVLPALAAVFAAVPGCRGQRPEAKPFTVVPVSAGIWMLTGEGGNIALAVGSDTTLLVDTDYARSAPRLAEAIRGLTRRPVHYVLDTHWHADHAEGNAALAAAGAVIVAQENTRARLSTEQVMRGHHFPPPPPAARPTISFRDTFTFRLGGGNDALVTWVGPAHTDGDVIVFFKKANVIHTGDLTCYYAYPFFDEERGVAAHGQGDVAALSRQHPDAGAYGDDGERFGLRPLPQAARNGGKDGCQGREDPAEKATSHTRSAGEGGAVRPGTGRTRGDAVRQGRCIVGPPGSQVNENGRTTARGQAHPRVLAAGAQG